MNQFCILHHQNKTRNGQDKDRINKRVPTAFLVDRLALIYSASKTNFLPIKILRLCINICDLLIDGCFLLIITCCIQLDIWYLLLANCYMLFNAYCLRLVICYLHPSIGLKHVNRMLKQKPAFLTRTPISAQQHSHVWSIISCTTFFQMLLIDIMYEI